MNPTSSETAEPKANPQKLIHPADVAEAHYNGPTTQDAATDFLKKVRRVGYRELVRKFGLPNKTSKESRTSANQLSGMVRDWEERGMIHHRIRRDPNELLPRRPLLEDRLRRRFGLRQAVVVDTSNLERPSGYPAPQSRTWNNYEDQVHKHLGAWGARLLMSCLRPGDTIGTGGGRGPYYTAGKCKVGEATLYSGDIHPLTGLISAKSWNSDDEEEGSAPFLDADHVAFHLHLHLGSRGKVRSINRPITSKGPQPSTVPLDVALVGIGALGGGHRLKSAEDLPDVRDVGSQLNEINKAAEAIERAATAAGLPFYHPVGDVCNWYFPVSQAPSQPLSKELQVLAHKIDKLNLKFLNVTPKALAQVGKTGMVLAVAGGLHKAFAIQHVLRHHPEGPWVTHLVTDHATAAWILRAEDLGDSKAGSVPIITNV